MKLIWLLIGLTSFASVAHGSLDDCTDTYPSSVCRSLLENNQYRRRFRTVKDRCAHTFGLCDTTGDCQPGWYSFNGACYFMNPKKVNFREAMKYCSDHDGVLASLINDDENEAAVKLAKRDGVSDFWIGVFQMKDRSVSVLDDSRLEPKVSNFEFGKQSAKTDDQGVTVLANGQWAMKNIDTTHAFLCSRLSRNFCAKRPCGSHAYCTFGGEEHICRCADGYFGDPYVRCDAPCECSGIGDPHYSTFDDMMISFMGRCRYILAQSEKDNHNCGFRIEVQNEDRRQHAVSNVNVSWTRTVYFNFRQKDVELRRDAKITVDGEVTEEFSNSDFKVHKVNQRETEILPDPRCGIFYIRFDSTNVKVKLNKYVWRGKVNGICGDCDGNAMNDLRTRGGLDVSKFTDRYAQIGNSWRILTDKESEECDDKNIEWPKCDEAMRKQIESASLCGAVRLSTEFKSCANKYKRVASDIFGSCVLDNCVFKNSGMRVDKCAYLTEFADFCRGRGFRMPNWRRTHGCLLRCPVRSQYTYDLPKNEESCASRVGLVAPNVFTKIQELTDKEGCICSKGYVRSGGQCVDNCGCKDPQGRYRNKGTKWIARDCKTQFSCDGPNKLSKKSISCVANAQCEKAEGAYTCVCKPGFSGSGFHSCRDNNECLKHPCDKLAVCSNTPGSYICTCRTGYEGDGVTCCKDSNECILKTHKCGTHAKCVNTIGSYECACQLGYRLKSDKRNCENINECKSKNICPITSQCRDLSGSYRCDCMTGYKDANNGRNPKKPMCIDEDECKLRRFRCHRYATCVNTVGSYTCACRVGYIGDGKYVCDDENECLDEGKDSGICSHKCINTHGSYRCECRKGYRLVGKSKCIDLDECKIPTLKSQCRPNSVCVNTPGSFQCNCIEGYRGEGRVECTRINVCEEEKPCNKFQTCEDTAPGKYVCKCRLGFKEVKGVCIDFDECTKKKACHVLADCYNTLGSYNCRCIPGTKGDGKIRCDDLDECKLGRHKCDTQTSFCKNFVPGYACECKPGYRRTKDFKCIDDNECLGKHKCRADQDCLNTPGSYKCKCKKGFREVGKKCIDLDECKLINTCDGRAARCTNKPGSYSCECINNYRGNGHVCTHIGMKCKIDPRTKKQECKCGRGYMISNDKSDCIDINECTFTKRPRCDKNARCFNLDGSYLCKCNKGYCGSGYPGECDDYDECSEGANRCHKYATCFNTPGSYMCKCRDGFIGDGLVCKDFNECDSKDTNDCYNADCQNKVGGYTCNCKSGFRPDPTDPLRRKCIDINECDGTHKCDLNLSTCKNLIGTYECVCKRGFYKMNRVCVNINECRRGTDKCSNYAKCTDTVGSYTCECNEGFVGDGRQCTNVNECSMKNDCHADAVCIDEIGSYTCRCKSGFRGNGKQCRQIDECKEGRAQCDEHSKCVDTHGSYECTCNQYYIGSGKAPNKCELDLIDECKKGTDSCDDTTEDCVDLPKGFRCDCKTGYQRQGDVCYDVNECVGTNSCGKNAICSNIPGSYKCTCEEGFTGDGKVCKDIDECSTSEDNCDTSTSVCKNTIGAYVCECKKGYERVGGNMCRDINECATTNKCDKQTTFCANIPGGYDCYCLTGHSTILGNPFKCAKDPNFGGDSKTPEDSFYEDF